MARTIALRRLTSKARSRHELERSLAARHVPEPAAQAVLDRLSEVGLVDDDKFAREWITSRQSRRRLSGRALRRELETKGVDRSIVDAALAEVAVDNEFELALELGRRRHKGLTGLPRATKVRRLAGALGRRGFSSDVIGRVVDQLLDLDLE